MGEEGSGEVYVYVFVLMLVCDRVMIVYMFNRDQ